MRNANPFSGRAGCKERDVPKNRDAGPVKCNAWFGGDYSACAALRKRLPEESVFSVGFHHCATPVSICAVV